jgi:hypothetical protein
MLRQAVLRRDGAFRLTIVSSSWDSPRTPHFNFSASGFYKDTSPGYLVARLQSFMLGSYAGPRMDGSLSDVVMEPAA